MDPKLIEALTDTGVVAAIIGAVALLFGPTHIDRFRATCAAILGGGCAAVVLGVFQMDQGFRDESVTRIAIAVISGLIGFIKFVASKK